MTDVPQILAAILFSSGCLCLSALLLTINSFESVPRHPVLVNFLRTWLLWSAFMLYSTVASLAISDSQEHKSLVIFQTGLRDMLWMVTQIATLNLIIHTWIKMKFWDDGRESRREKIRTLIFVATPYIFGLIALIEIFPITSPRLSGSNLINLPIDLAMGCLFLTVTSLTFIWDVVLLYTFWRDRRILRQANLRGVMSLSMLFRILALCVYQLVMTIVCGIILKMANDIPVALITVAESLYPLLVFLLIGLRRDILRVWFPCLCARFDQVTQPTQDLEFDISVASITAGSQRSLMRSGEEKPC